MERAAILYEEFEEEGSLPAQRKKEFLSTALKRAITRLNQPEELHHTFVLSLYPTSRGYAYAYVLFEGAQSPYDWGVKDIRKKHKNDWTLSSIQVLIERYRPDYLVIEDYTEKGSRWSSRIRKLYRMLTHVSSNGTH